MTDGKAHPLLEYRPRFAEHRRDTIRTFGIKRVVKTLTLAEILNHEDDEAESHAKPNGTTHE